MVLAALALGYAYPVRVYLSQQAEIDRMEAGQEEQREHIDELAAQVEKWQDDAYVAARPAAGSTWSIPARSRWSCSGTTAGAARDAGGHPDRRRSRLPAPWYGKLWTSIEVANR